MAIVPAHVAMFVEIKEQSGNDFRWKSVPASTVVTCDLEHVTADQDPVSGQVRVALHLRVVNAATGRHEDSLTSGE